MENSTGCPKKTLLLSSFEFLTLGKRESGKYGCGYIKKRCGYIGFDDIRCGYIKKRCGYI